MGKVVSPALFDALVMEAMNLLKAQDLPAFHQKIVDAIALNMDAPQPHNLLGIACEMTGDDCLARKHYRAAYALDPTYKPACRNLERLSVLEWSPDYRKFDYGL